LNHTLSKLNTAAAAAVGVAAQTRKSQALLTPSDGQILPISLLNV